MNYRTLVKGALALSLSLTVASAFASTTTSNATQIYGATFESTADGVNNDYNYTVGDPVTNYFTEVGGEKVKGWFGGDSDESKIISANDGAALQLNTDAGVLTNLLDTTSDGIADQVNTAIAAEGSSAYFETEVKFVASDTLDAGIQGGQDTTKFAIYAYCDENATPATTNLVVYHAYYDGNSELAYTNEQFGAVNCDDYTTIRVEMKQMPNPNTGMPLNVFSVKVGDTQLTSETAFGATAGNPGPWFLTVEDTSNDDYKLVSALNFKGTGEIDNIKVGTITEVTSYAIDWTDSDGVTVTKDGNTLTTDQTNFVAGAEIVFTATGENVVITNITVDGAAQTITNNTVYSYFVGSADAIVKVLAGVEQQTQKPTWAADSGDGSASDPYWAWAKDHAAGQDLNAQGANYSAQYLMDIDADKTPVLKIDSIEVTAEGSKIVVSATDGTSAIDLEDINGKLNVSVGSSLANLASKNPADYTTYAGGKATIIIPAANGAFAKATVDFTAAATKLQAVATE